MSHPSSLPNYQSIKYHAIPIYLESTDCWISNRKFQLFARARGLSHWRNQPTAGPPSTEYSGKVINLDSRYVAPQVELGITETPLSMQDV